jgi:hypothetical protein
MKVVAKRATFDLGCSRERLDIRELSKDTFGVTGCNKRATYLITCVDWDCQAVMNTKSEDR